MKLCGDFTIGSRFVNLTTFLRQAGADFNGNVKTLTFKSLMIHVKIMASILRLFPNLEEVKIVNVRTPSDDVGTVLSDIEIPTLAMLKKLVFRAESSSLLLACFEKARISTMEGTNQTFNSQEIARFLSQQPELTDLDFCRLASHQFCLTRILTGTIKFKLKRLALDYVSMADFEQIINLLFTQVWCLETLEVGHIPDVIYEFLFSCPRKLKTLHFIPGAVATDTNFSITLKINKKITTLRMYDGARYGLDYQKIREVAIKAIENLPNLETLELFIPYDQNFFNAIVANLKKLKSLQILVPFRMKLEHLKIPAVEQLRIKCFNGEAFTMMSPGESCQPHPELKSLIYEGVTDPNFLSTVRKNFPNLESLDLRKELAEFELASITGIEGVKYRDEDFFNQKVRF